MDSRSQFAPFRFSNAIGYAKFYSRSHDAVIRVCDSAGNVIETHEQAISESWCRKVVFGTRSASTAPLVNRTFGSSLRGSPFVGADVITVS